MKPEYRLTSAAEADLMAIADYGDERFGVRQSDQYRARLLKRFEFVAKQPLHYPRVDHIRPGYLQHRQEVLKLRSPNWLRPSLVRPARLV